MVLNNRAWMLPFDKNDENFLDAINAWCLENNCKTSMITAKKLLYHLWKSIYEDYSNHTKSQIYMPHQQHGRKATHISGNSKYFAKYWLQHYHFFVIKMDLAGPTISDTIECCLQTGNRHSYPRSPHLSQPSSHSRFWRVDRY